MMALLAQAGGLVIWLWTGSGAWTLLVEGIIFISGIWIIAPHLSADRVRDPVPQTGSQATLAWIFLAVATLAMLAAAVAIATDVERSARSMALGFLAEFPTAAVAIGGYMLLSPRIVAEGVAPAGALARSSPILFWLAAFVMGAAACFQSIDPHPLDRPLPHDLTAYMLTAGTALMIAAAVETARRWRTPVSSPRA